MLFIRMNNFIMGIMGRSCSFSSVILSVFDITFIQFSMFNGQPIHFLSIVSFFIEKEVKTFFMVNEKRVIHLEEKFRVILRTRWKI